jgi:hypothetical protein
MYKTDPKFYLKSFNEINNILINEFDAGLTKLKAAMAEYLNFHTVER